MAKLIFTAAVLVVFVAIAEASIYRTTVTTTEIEEHNPSESQRCREQIRGQQLSQCQQYLRHEQRGLLLSSVGNQDMLQQCCRQLQEVDEQCRCEAIRQMVQQQQGEYQGEQMQEMVRRAESLPQMCGMRPQHCQIRGLAY